MADQPGPPHFAAVLHLDLTDSSQAATGPREERRDGQVKKAAELAAEEAGHLWNPVDNQGDLIRQCFADPLGAVRCAFALRHLFTDPALQIDEPHLPILLPRIVLHYGRVDPPRVGGEPPPVAGGHAFQVAGPLEKDVIPGEIWATGELVAMCELTGDSPFLAEYLFTSSNKKLPTPHELYRLHLRAMMGAKGRARRARPDPVQLAISLLQKGGVDEDRIAAADALGMLHDTRALEALIKVAMDGEEPFRLRRESLLSIEQHADPSATQNLITLDDSLKDEPLLQRVAIQALGATGDPKALEKLVAHALFRDRSPGIREAALLALRHVPLDSAATSALTQGLEDLDPVIVGAACVGAVAAPADAKLIEALVQVLLNEPKKRPLDVRAAALETLLKLPSDDAGADLIAQSIVGRDSDIPPRLRYGMVEYLGRVGSRAALEALQDLAQRWAEPAQAAAVLALAALHSVAPPRRRFTILEASSHDRIIELRTERKAG